VKNVNGGKPEMKQTRVTVLLLAVMLSGLAACGNPSGASGEKSVDLSTFYDELEAKYDLPEMMEISDETLESYYPGLKDISLKQRVVKIPKLTSTVSEYVFVECENAEDVAKVTDILQARIDAQAAGGAWYPVSVAAWGQAAVETNGNYVAMVAAGEDTETIVSDWNALFK
jgi:hypothetical protein